MTTETASEVSALTILSSKVSNLRHAIAEHPKTNRVWFSGLSDTDIRIKLGGDVDILEQNIGRGIIIIVTGSNRLGVVIGIMRLQNRLYRHTPWQLYGKDSYLVVIPTQLDPQATSHELARAIVYDPQATAAEQQKGRPEWRACCSKTYLLNGTTFDDPYMQIAGRAITEANNLLKS